MPEWPQHKILIFQTLKDRELRSQRSDLVELIRDVMDYGDVMDILVTSKNREEPNKNESSSLATTQNSDFSNTQGQLTPVRGRI